MGTACIKNAVVRFIQLLNYYLIPKRALGFLLVFVCLTFMRKDWYVRQRIFQLVDRPPSCISNSPGSISYPDIVISRAMASLPSNSASKLVSGEVRSGPDSLWVMGEERESGDTAVL